MTKHRFWLTAAIHIVFFTLFPLRLFPRAVEPSAPLFENYFLGQPVEILVINTLTWSVFWIWLARRARAPAFH